MLLFYIKTFHFPTLVADVVLYIYGGMVLREVEQMCSQVVICCHLT